MCFGCGSGREGGEWSAGGLGEVPSGAAKARELKTQRATKLLMRLASSKYFAIRPNPSLCLLSRASHLSCPGSAPGGFFVLVVEMEALP